MSRFCVAFGPRMPGWGSWEWVGQDLHDQLSDRFLTRILESDGLADVDAIVVVKHPIAVEIPKNTALVFCPVDQYGSPSEIEADAEFLARCDRVVVHAPSLRPFFELYAPVADLDHHVKYAALITNHRPEGFILWTGVRSNLAPLVEWVNRHPLPRELRVLTNLDNPIGYDDPTQLGFPQGAAIRVAPWSKELHVAWASRAGAAIDIKGIELDVRQLPHTSTR